MNTKTTIMKSSGQRGEVPKLPPADFDSVVIVSPYVWLFREGMWQTTHQLAIEFARLYPTVYVEPSAPWDPRADWFYVGGVLRNIVGKRTSRVNENLSVFHRRGLPFGRHSSISDRNLRRNVEVLRQYLRERGFEKPLLWHSFPYGGEPFVDVTGYRAFAYHCLDHSQQEEEARLIRRAEAVFCVSETLVKKHRQINPGTHLLPNGVDLRLFGEEKFRNLGRPPALPTGGRIIGFVGSLNYHLDLELLVKVAKAFPHDYVAIAGTILGNHTAPQGRQLVALEQLRGLPNVRMLGFVAAAQLPAHLQAFDVCLIPLIDNPFNMERDPLKFYQYMASGKPVVTTPVMVALENSSLCSVADSHDEFVSHVSDALAGKEPSEARQKRLEFARQHSWEAIAQHALTILCSVARHKPDAKKVP
jgi:glycosyltransferase involved in cell wall biosynthesis